MRRSILIAALLAFPCLGASLTPSPVCGTATASYGSLYAYTDGYSGHCSTFSTSWGAGVQVNAAFEDSATVVGGTSDGYVSMVVNYTRLRQGEGGTSGTAYLGSSILSFSAQWAYEALTKTVEIPFTVGAAFRLAGTTNATTYWEPGSPSSTVSSYLSIRSLTVLDANHNPISGYTYRTDSGSAYNFVGGTLAAAGLSGLSDSLATPEPASGVLVAATAMVLVLMRRRGR